jgi:hypothetical protein
VPMGKPKLGFRLTKRLLAEKPELALLKAEADAAKLHVSASKSKSVQEALATYEPPVPETDKEIRTRLSERFDVLQRFTMAAINNDIRALIVSGPPGLGKSFTVEKTIEKLELDESQFVVVKGYLTAASLYRLLYQYRRSENVLVFDDADSIFYDDNSLNFLKTACDTTEIRKLSYMSERQMMTDGGESVPTSFVFDASVIFITNLDFDTMISAGHRLEKHLSALISRSHYIDLTLKTRRDYIVRIKQVIDEGLLSDMPEDHVIEILDFIEANQAKLRELSLRMAVKLAQIRRMHLDEEWEAIARVTCCRA